MLREENQQEKYEWQETLAVRRSGSVVRHINEITLSIKSVSTGMSDRLRAGTSLRCVTSQLGQLSVASLLGR